MSVPNRPGFAKPHNASMALAALLILPSCTSEAEKAEKAYDMAADGIYIAGEKCRLARAAREQWLQEGDRDKFEHWDSQAYQDCASSRRGF